jgi:hypothetical protein
MSREGNSMRIPTWMKPAALAALAFPALAVDVDVRVILQGDVRPGVYGRVDFGSAPPPAPLLVYEKPVIIVQPPPPPRPVVVQPVYLHVPPGHAKDWKKHCKKYNACGVPVYFVKSEEYEPKKAKKEKKPKKEG